MSCPICDAIAKYEHETRVKVVFNGHLLIDLSLADVRHFQALGSSEDLAPIAPTILTAEFPPAPDPHKHCPICQDET